MKVQPRRVWVLAILAAAGFGLTHCWLLQHQEKNTEGANSATPAATPVAAPAEPFQPPPAIVTPEPPPVPDPLKAFAWDGPRQGLHILCQCQDPQGRLWIGTEGQGIWCWDPALALQQRQAEPAGEAAAPGKLYGWSQFTRISTGGQAETLGPALTTGTVNVNSLGDDDIYAIACDRQGRIWAGHLNHGVSVYDGRPIPPPGNPYPGWRNYDVLAGPLGERVFCIGVNPADGDVWIGTDAGLSRYRPAANTWSYYTRGTGLPSDQVQALAFLKDGTLIAGTQCDGLAIARPANPGQLEFPSWRQITTPEFSDDPRGTPAGDGLPGNLINDVLVTRTGTIVVATTAGIASSADGGTTWSFLRGEDWADKLRGLHKPPEPAAIETARQALPAGKSLLLEDYCTTLAEDAAGNLWIGHWRKGLEILATDGRRLLPPAIDDDDEAAVTLATPKNAYVRTILAGFRGRTVTGCYGEGLALEPATTWQQAMPNAAPASQPLQAELPKPAATPGRDEILAITKKLATPSLPDAATPWGYFVGDDWMSQGDWVGRYGRKRVLFPGTGGGFTNKFGYEPSRYNALPYLGLNHNDKDRPRGWCWESKNNQDRRIMYFLCLGIRRPGGWCDHGDAYPVTASGPDLWLDLELPDDGMSLVSFHFMNYDGREKGCRQRDYLVELRTELYGGKLLARTRVHDFWGGLYKQFAVSGKNHLYLKVSRNHSNNVMVLGALFDKIQGPQDMADKIDLHIMFLRNLKEYRIPRIETLGTLGDLAIDPKVFTYWRIADAADRGSLIRYIRSQHPGSPAETYIKWSSDYWLPEDRLLFQRATQEIDRTLDKQNIKR